MNREQIMEMANSQTRQIATRLLDGDIQLSNREWDLIRDAIYINACEARRRQSELVA